MSGLVRRYLRPGRKQSALASRPLCAKVPECSSYPRRRTTLSPTDAKEVGPSCTAGYHPYRGPSLRALRPIGRDSLGAQVAAHFQNGEIPLVLFNEGRHVLSNMSVSVVRSRSFDNDNPQGVEQVLGPTQSGPYTVGAGDTRPISDRLKPVAGADSNTWIVQILAPNGIYTQVIAFRLNPPQAGSTVRWQFRWWLSKQRFTRIDGGNVGTTTRLMHADGSDPVSGSAARIYDNQAQ